MDTLKVKLDSALFAKNGRAIPIFSHISYKYIFFVEDIQLFYITEIQY
jgi:hypothetical protein